MREGPDPKTMEEALAIIEANQMMMRATRAAMAVDHLYLETYRAALKAAGLKVPNPDARARARIDLSVHKKPPTEEEVEAQAQLLEFVWAQMDAEAKP